MGRRKLSSATTAAAVVVAVGALLLSPVAAQPAAGRSSPPAGARLAVPDLAWRPCGTGFPGTECATATVPLDYDRPNGPTTTIALARVPATAPGPTGGAGDPTAPGNAPRVGSLFVNPGGPGGSGVGLVLGGFGKFLADQLGGRFDIVGFDPRGVGASDPLHCFASKADLDAFLAAQPVFPFRGAQFAPYFRHVTGLNRECRDDRQVVVEHMSTADVVRDLDLLRRSVGDRELTYLGFSYGSYLGNTYANMFPRRVRALVIDGVLDPRLWSSGRQIVSDRIATQEEFAEFLRLCEAAGRSCAFGAGPPQAAARWERLASRLRERPVRLADGTVYGYDFLIGDGVSAMFDPGTWGGREGFGALFDAVADAALSGAAPNKVAALRARLHQRLQGPTMHGAVTSTRAVEANYANDVDAYYGNQCADTGYPSTLGAFRAIDRFALRGSRFGPFWWWGNAPCANWPTSSDRYSGPWDAQTAQPVLVVGNFFDGVTDLRGAQASSRLLHNSRLLSYAGWGHTAYGTSDCVTDDVNAYLIDRTLPAPGKVCPANPNPFLPAAERLLAEQPAKYVGLPPGWLLQR